MQNNRNDSTDDDFIRLANSLGQQKQSPKYDSSINDTDESDMVTRQDSDNFERVSRKRKRARANTDKVQ